MKNIIILLLIIVMCLPLMACTNMEETKVLNEKIGLLEEKIENLEKDNVKSEDHASKIIGTWETSEDGGVSLTFNADGTGTINGGKTTMKWKYDSELSAYICIFQSTNIMGGFFIENDEYGARYLQYMEYKLYYKDN